MTNLFQFNSLYFTLWVASRALTNTHKLTITQSNYEQWELHVNDHSTHIYNM